MRCQPDGAKHVLTHRPRARQAYCDPGLVRADASPPVLRLPSLTSPFADRRGHRPAAQVRPSPPPRVTRKADAPSSCRLAQHAAVLPPLCAAAHEPIASAERASHRGSV